MREMGRESHETQLPADANRAWSTGLGEPPQGPAGEKNPWAAETAPNRRRRYRPNTAAYRTKL